MESKLLIKHKERDRVRVDTSNILRGVNYNGAS